MNKFRFKGMALMMAIVVLMGVLAGCAPKTTVGVEQPASSNEDSAKLKVTDDFGVEVVLDKVPEKIVSLAPSHTEILFALGLGDKVVGVTSYCDYPKEALAVEKVGDFSGNNLEKIIELSPDLVIQYGSGDENENARLKEAGINVIGFEPESIDEIIDTINRIGQITGTADNAETLTDKMIKDKDEIISKLKNTEKVKVFYEIWHDPLMAAGPGSFMDQLMALAGGENIASDAQDEYPQFDLEQLVERNPEVYLTSADMPEKTVESMIARPGYENIEAMKTGRVYVLDANIVSRPGPRIIEALELVAKAIHPEIFK